MTSRTVEVETKEMAEVTICDECGLGSDRGRVLAFEATNADEKIHLHRSCLRQLGIAVDEEPSIADVAYSTETPRLAYLQTDVGLFILFLGVGAFYTGAGWYQLAPSERWFGMAIMALSVLLTLFGALLGFRKANTPIDELLKQG